jgi:hypothetical protein
MRAAYRRALQMSNRLILEREIAGVVVIRLKTR